MYTIYILTDGNRFAKPLIKDIINEKLELEDKEIINILEYFKDEGLIDGSNFTTGGSVSITHKGVVEIEAAITIPKERTEHFISQVSMNLFANNIGSIQTGHNNQATTFQNQ